MMVPRSHLLFFRMLDSTVRHSLQHTSQSHDGIERQNRIYNDIVKALNFAQFPQMAARWDEYVKTIQFFLNYSLVGRHGMSPLFFSFGATHAFPPLLRSLMRQLIHARSS